METATLPAATADSKPLPDIRRRLTDIAVRHWESLRHLQAQVAAADMNEAQERLLPFLDDAVLDAEALVVSTIMSRDTGIPANNLISAAWEIRLPLAIEHEGRFLIAAQPPGADPEDEDGEMQMRLTVLEKQCLHVEPSAA